MIGLRASVAAFLRLFAVQAAWNHRTMIGSGFAFALAPILRRVHADPERLREALARHVGPFNAHPYLAGLAVGAVGRMEAEGADPAAVERFKAAVRGPLGGLGDQLIWARALPATALVAGGIGLSLERPLAGVLLFLIPYNVIHLGLRMGAFRAGLQSGSLVAPRIRRMSLGGWTSRLRIPVALGVGLVLGGLVLLVRPAGPSPATLWGLGVVAAFAFGAQVGAKVWRPLVGTLVLAVFLISVVGRVT